MQHFKSLPPAQRYRYLSGILHQQDAPQSPPSAVGETFELPPVLYIDHFTLNLTPLFLGKNYDAFLRYDYTRRSLLTASLYHSKPLTKDQAEIIIGYSYYHYNKCATTLSTVAVGAVASLCVSAVYLMRPRSHYLSLKKREFWMKLNMIWIHPFVAAGLNVFELRLDRSMERPQLSELAGKEIPHKAEQIRSYRDNIVPRDLLKTRPTFKELYSGLSQDDEWRRLKYNVSTFLDSPEDEQSFAP